MSCHQWSRPATMSTSSPSALDDDRRLDRRRVGERLVGVLLEPDRLAAPIAAVGGDQDLGPAVVDPARQRLRREAAEHDRVRRPDPGAGEHRDRQLGDHRHVDRDPVAGLDAELLERVGRLADLALEVAEGQRPGVARLADPVVGDLVAQAALDVAVDAVVGDVELAAGEPLRERQLPFERLVERLRPVDPLAGALRPERLEVGLRLGVQVGGRVGLGGEGRVGREEPRLGEEVFDLRRRKRVLDAHGSPRVAKLGWPGHRTALHGPRATGTGRPVDSDDVGHPDRGRLDPAHGHAGRGRAGRGRGDRGGRPARARRSSACRRRACPATATRPGRVPDVTQAALDDALATVAAAARERGVVGDRRHGTADAGRAARSCPSSSAPDGTADR